MRRIRLLGLSALVFGLVACGGGTNQLTTDIPDEPEETVIDINVDILSHRASGDLFVDSAPSSPVNPSNALFYLQPLSDLASETGNNILLGNWLDGEYDIAVLQGSYQPLFTPGGGDAMPLNLGERLFPIITVDTDVIQAIDVETIEVSPALTLNGNSFPSDADESADIFLQSQNSDFFIYWGNTNTSNQNIRIIPGTYDVIYSYNSGVTIPQNTNAVVLESRLIDSDGRVEIDIESASVRSLFRFEGNPFPNSGLIFANMYLRNASEDEVFLGPTNTSSSASSTVIYGEYNAHYEFREGSDTLPINSDAIVEYAIAINEDNEQITLNVMALPITGSFTINGVAPSLSGLEFANIYLQNSETDEQILLGSSNSQSYAEISIIPGDYHLLYDFREGVSTMPNNSETVFERNRTFASGGNFDVDIPAANITADLTINGESFPESGLDYGRIYAQQVGSTQTFLLGNTNEVFQTTPLLQGNYDFFYEFRETQGVSPVNHFFPFLTNVSITGDQTIQHDFITRNVRVLATLNGDEFPDSGLNYARIYLGNNEQDQILAVRTFEEPLELNVIAGNYNIYYSVWENASEQLPVNQGATVTQVVVE